MENMVRYGGDDTGDIVDAADVADAAKEDERLDITDAAEEDESLDMTDTAEEDECPEYSLEEPPEPSEVFRGFLDYLKLCQEEYQTNIQEVWKHDRALQDDVHAFEFAETDEEAARLGIEFSAKRKERREHKDEAYRYEEGARFCGDKDNKMFLDRIRSMIDRQERREEYLDGDRFYRPRGGENNEED